MKKLLLVALVALGTSLVSCNKEQMVCRKLDKEIAKVDKEIDEILEDGWGMIEYVGTTYNSSTETHDLSADEMNAASEHVNWANSKYNDLIKERSKLSLFYKKNNCQ